MWKVVFQVTIALFNFRVASAIFVGSSNVTNRTISPIPQYDKLESRIRYGFVSDYKKYEYVVQIHIKPKCKPNIGRESKPRKLWKACSGSLISQKMILTAAHCVLDFDNMLNEYDKKVVNQNKKCFDGLKDYWTTIGNTKVSIYPVDWYEIYVGFPLNAYIHNLVAKKRNLTIDGVLEQNNRMQNANILEIENVYINKNFSIGINSRMLLNDIALLELKNYRKAAAREKDDVKKAKLLALVANLGRIKGRVNLNPHERVNRQRLCLLLGWPQVLDISDNSLVYYDELVKLMTSPGVDKSTIDDFIHNNVTDGSSVVTLQELAMYNEDSPTPRTCYFKRSREIEEKRQVLKDVHYMCLASKPQATKDIEGYTGIDEGPGEVQLFGGPCAGDSGGPVICHNGKERDSFSIVGVTSFGPVSCSATPSNPALFTQVTGYSGFIKGALEIPPSISSVFSTSGKDPSTELF